MNGNVINRSHRGSSPLPGGRRKIVPATTMPFSPPRVTRGTIEDTARGRHYSADVSPEFPTPMNALDRLRQQSLAVTGGRTANMFPQYERSADFAREEEIRTKTNQKRPIAIVPRRTPANDNAGPPLDTNLTQITSDEQGRLDTSEWMHSWWGHACGCGETEAEEVRRVNGRQV